MEKQRIEDREISISWWNGLEKDFSENSQFSKMQKFLETQRMIGFSSKDGRLLSSLTGSEIEKLYKHFNK
jgi:hypothetical protein